jgi:predicted nuclease of predicted toxin-antitoxin system
MRLLIDEHLSPAIAEQLRARGHDVVSPVEAGVSGIDDGRVLSWAVADRRAIATNNIKDFRPLHAAYLTAGTTHYGIVLVQSGKYALDRQHLGPLVSALDELLQACRAEDALCDAEYFV